ncbi:hypothetical protein BJ875DRAFT_485556 [Amylocarpus encephaloides]|uniref:Uncharacterized protein n=1 Tax=Amylocarpus encephaloides TaxID=45428 RepID=A0A9P7YH38_9HELO|nr:hypothetical protein BJ875DRAFT_485556 [Amylocarpus encephaloides]
MDKPTDEPNEQDEASSKPRASGAKRWMFSKNFEEVREEIHRKETWFAQLALKERNLKPRPKSLPNSPTPTPIEVHMDTNKPPPASDNTHERAKLLSQRMRWNLIKEEIKEKLRKQKSKTRRLKKRFRALRASYNDIPPYSKGKYRTYSRKLAKAAMILPLELEDKNEKIEHATSLTKYNDELVAHNKDLRDCFDNVHDNYIRLHDIYTDLTEGADELCRRMDYYRDRVIELEAKYLHDEGVTGELEEEEAEKEDDGIDNDE